MTLIDVLPRPASTAPRTLLRLWRWLTVVALGAGQPARARARGRSRFESLVLPHLDAAYTLARYLTRSADAADDVVQDAVLRAFRAFDGYRGGTPRAWLLAIVRNCCRDWATERGRAPQSGQDAEELDTEPLWTRPPEDAEQRLLRAGESARIRAAIEALPLPLREVLVLREFDELSYAEIAAVIGAPAGTVMSRLARAREHFARLWRGLENAEGTP